MSWHPVRKIIAVGWSNGELLMWNEHDRDLHEVYSIHKSKINTVKWSYNGHRLVSGDQVILKKLKTKNCMGIVGENLKCKINILLQRRWNLFLGVITYAVCQG